jgi:hypothetical protein
MDRAVREREAMITYAVLECDPDERYELVGHDVPDELGATLCAEDFYAFHEPQSGWSSIWPLTFLLFDEDGNEASRWTVEKESVTTFSSNLIPSDEKGKP